MNNANGTRFAGRLNRRDVLRGAGLAMGGVAGGALFGCGGDSPSEVDLADESLPPETRRLVIPANDGTICLGPLYVAEMFFGDEGFTDIQHPVISLLEFDAATADGRIDLYQDFGASLLKALDAGGSSRLLAGIHAGCYELFAREGISSISELKGKRIGVPLGVSPAAGELTFMASILAFVGIDEDYSMVSFPAEDVPALLQSGTIDAVAAVPPFAEPVRAANAGHVLVDSAVDRPWSSYFCCMLAASDTFVRKNPIATKRALRAVLRAVDLCATDPEKAAHYLVDKGHTEDYQLTLRTLKHLPYNVWRQYDPGETVRFNALRLREVGLIKKTPDQLARHGDWRFLNQLKHEMAYAPPSSANRSAFALDCNIDPVAGVVGPRQG
jgi:NitT/TauT family transport system substrate-binding protein